MSFYTNFAAPNGSFDDQFKDLLLRILQSGEIRGDRTGTGTLSVFAPPQIVVDLSLGTWDAESGRTRHPWPVTTLRKINAQAALVEMLWVLKGDTNTAWLKQNGVNYWDKWADPNGQLGPVYGAQMRNFGGFGRLPSHGIDQLTNVVESLVTNPFSRRHMISLWNPVEEVHMQLPPCHGCIIQFYAGMDGTLSVSMYQRSCDVVIGLPYNIAMYASLLYCVAALTGRTPGKMIFQLGDAHIYRNLEVQALQLTGRTPMAEATIEIPEHLVSLDSLERVEPHEFTIRDYVSHPAISCPVSV